MEEVRWLRYRRSRGQLVRKLKVQMILQRLYLMSDAGISSECQNVEGDLGLEQKIESD
jgi:uncharacterized protein YjiS (DUF1127 family)